MEERRSEQRDEPTVKWKGNSKRKRRNNNKNNVKGLNKDDNIDDLVIYYNNLNGFDSKSESICNIVNNVLPKKDLSPNVVGINETLAKFD